MGDEFSKASSCPSPDIRCQSSCVTEYYLVSREKSHGGQESLLNQEKHFKESSHWRLLLVLAEGLVLQILPCSIGLRPGLQPCTQLLLNFIDRDVKGCDLPATVV